MIDLIAPAPASRALHSRSAGPFHVDKFPGIQYALNEPALVVDVNAVPLEGPPYGPFRIAVPSITAALVIKALAARTRHRDKEDIHRLLAAADAAAVTLPEPPYSNLDIGRAAEYLHAPSCRARHSRHAQLSIAPSRAHHSVPSSSTSDAIFAPLDTFDRALNSPVPERTSTDTGRSTSPRPSCRFPAPPFVLLRRI